MILKIIEMDAVYKKILEHINEATLLFNQNLELTYINTAGEILFADSARHLQGIPVEDLFGSNNTLIVEAIHLCLNKGEPVLDRELNLQLIKQTVTVNFTATPLYEHEQLTDILVELQQVDQHMRITREEQLMAQHNTAKMLIRGLAHEIKNPLGGLRGAAQLLDSELNDPDNKEYTKIIIAESDRLQGLMDRMLGPNKLPKKVKLNIHEVLERVRQLVTAESQDDTLIKIDYDPSIPEIEADKDLLIQAILNIVRNADQATDEKGIIILKTRIFRQKTISRKKTRLSIKIDIIDNGPGIKPELINQIFYPLITGRASGTGLGLSIAQSLINQHHGFIECNSHEGKTIFSIYLPLEKINE